MGWEWLIVPLGLVGIALAIHGLPSLITINKYYYKDDDK